MNTLTATNDEKSHKRSVARLCAVQALYQLRMSSDTGTKAVVDEFKSHRLKAVNDPEQLGDADEKHFAGIVEGVNQRADEIDELIKSALNKEWRIERLEHTMLSILRAGVFEILACSDIPVAVIVNEYVELAKSFYDGSEVGFVNGILDNLATKCRT